MGKLFTPQDLKSGFNSNASLNANFNNIEDAFDKCVSLDGSITNTVNQNFDMNDYNITNVNSVEADTVVVGGVDLTQKVNEASTYAAEAASSAADALAAYNNILYLDVVTETGNFTLDDGYTNKMVMVDSSSGVTCTIGPGTIGMQVLVIQAGTGAVTFTSSDSILSKLGTVTDGQGAVASVIRYAEDAVYINGQLMEA